MEEVRKFGRFMLHSVLGRGGMGEVWKARDESLGRWVAIKFVKGLDAEHLARFLREARTAATLEHANIATIYEAGEIDGTPFLAMQFIDGKTLSKIEAPVRDVVRWIRDAALAVHFANERGIVHRDLKPDNLMVAEDRVYVMDFGLAKEMESAMTASGLAVGTPAYMSPEAARGEVRKADARSDVYGLGATLYDLLAGHAPFDGKDVVHILMAVIQEEAPPLREVDSGLAAVVFKCLEKDPERRYPSAKALADDLTRWLEGEAVEARPAGAWDRLRRRLQRRRTIVAVLLAALLVGGVLTTTLLAGTGVLEKRAEREQEALVRQLRENAASCLQAVLDQRRTGRLESGVTARLEEICGRLSIAESHHLLGRVYRAQMRDADALAEQERALGLDPEYAPAHYERAVLRAALFRAAVERAAEEYARREGLRLAAMGELTEYRPPTRLQLAMNDPDARRLLEGMRADLAAIPPSTCATGLLDWIEDRHEDARRRLNEALAADPDLDEVVLALAAIARDHGRHAEGRTLLTAAIDRDPGYVPFRELRGLIEHSLGLHHRAKDPESAFRAAIADYDEVIQRLPSRAETWRYRGLSRGRLAGLFERTGRDSKAGYETAIADFRQAGRRAPEDAQPWCDEAVAWVSIGTWHADAGQDPVPSYERAIESVGEALKRRPAFAYALVVKGSALLNRGHHLSSMGRDPVPSYEAAIGAYGDAISIDPGLATAWMQRGLSRCNWALYRLDRGGDAQVLVDQAVADLERATELSPGNPETWVELASARFNRGQASYRAGRDARDDYAKAEKDYNRAVQIAPAWDVPKRGRGLVRTMFGVEQRRRGHSPLVQYEAAEKDYADALAINPKRAKTWEDRAALNRAWGNFLATSGGDPVARFEAAARDAAESVRLNPRAADAWGIAGDARCNLGRWRSTRSDPMSDYEASVRAYGEALKITPDDAKSWAGRGEVRSLAAHWLLKRGGDAKPWLEGAFADFKRSLEIDPNAAQSWLCLGDLRSLMASKLGDADQKRKMLQSAIEAYDKAATLLPSLRAQVQPAIDRLRKQMGE